MILAKRLTLKQIEDITKLFISGFNIDQISRKFDCTKLTITRNLKKKLGEDRYKQIIEKIKLNNKLIDHKEKKIDYTNKNKENNTSAKVIKTNCEEIINKEIEEESYEISEFIEIAPLNFDIENSPRKDFSSILIKDIELPKIVFMIVDKKVELEIKYLRDYPKWQFLSPDELNRKTIEIYFDIKVAKGVCNKDHKVIKVPNSEVFKIAAPILISKGISRIVGADKLIAL